MKINDMLQIIFIIFVIVKLTISVYLAKNWFIKSEKDERSIGFFPRLFTLEIMLYSRNCKQFMYKFYGKNYKEILEIDRKFIEN